MRELRGKVAVVTGGASGIGLALAQRFAAEGMNLVLADIESGPLEEAKGKLEAGGASVLAVPTDVASADAMDALATATFERFGAVHVVCNNAGVGGGGPTWELTTEDWEFVVGPDLWGVIHGVRVFAKHLVAQDEGHIVNTASMAGLVSVPGVNPYNVSKHGVVTLSETLYGELRQANSKVGVSVLCPGFVKTRIFESQRHRKDAGPDAGPDAEMDPGHAEMIQGVLSGAMPPEEVARQVLEAIHEDRFYILTHPGTREAVEHRMRAIIEGRNPDPLPPMVFTGKG